MKELIAFLLPPATALAGMRINHWLLGKSLPERFGFGLRFALGMAVGMVLFSQSVMLTALAGLNLSSLLAWTALIWGAAEAVLLRSRLVAGFKVIKLKPDHGWLLLLLPVFYSWWVFGRLSTLEGTLEFDANAFWVFKAKIYYLAQGKDLVDVLHQSNLAYAHLDYPMLVPCLYTLNYGLLGGVDEFVNKVWPFWMVVTLCLAFLSLTRVWQQPRPLPILSVVVLCFLPSTLQFIRNEGGTIPMLFFTSLAGIVLVTALTEASEVALGAGILVLTGCATTKFEGVIYTALWGSLALFFAWRRGWLKSRLLWKVGGFSLLSLVPYACLRLSKPFPHPESGWIHNGLHTLGQVFHRFPQTLMLDLGSRFFSRDFFHWESPDKDHLQFTGHWHGWSSFINPELSLLPWVLVVMAFILFWQKATQRVALGSLLLVILGQFTILCFAMSCLAGFQKDAGGIIGFSGEPVGRYFYPFFTTLFLGITALWVINPEAASTAATTSTVQKPPAHSSIPPRPKKRR